MWSAAGFIATTALVALGPYPVAMVGLDTQGVTNSQPPKVTLLTLAIFQAGALLAMEGPARRMLAKTRTWAATTLINGRIMTLYLWHLTAMVALIGATAGADRSLARPQSITTVSPNAPTMAGSMRSKPCSR